MGDEAKTRLVKQFGTFEMLDEERSGYRAVLLGPPEGGSWATRDDAQMREVCTALDIRRGLVPTTVPEFSGRIAENGEPYVTHALDGERLIARFTNPCEGGWLGENSDALTLTLGGCMLVAARATTDDGMMRLVACHAGFHSLVDIGALEGRPPRTYEGVIESITAAFNRRYGTTPEEIDLECFFGLAPGTLIYHYDRAEVHKKYFDHLTSRWGAEVAEEVDTPESRAVAVDPGAIFLAQAEAAGFRSAARSCDITTDGPFANTRHKTIARNRPNFSAIIRTR